ncbi:ABC transporter ATP-binding protein [Occultella aeris]|uniref:sn-glycerol-3-phosphate import ATP-binding protein UgpC n=1 Tax=Occultella aeris TaxID=2761496 RepID=A0A7M4DJN0_9MICO|nr:ABC transporter ATP-binding protein [Occultella aeris]VZO37250.1 sn-glycerol-3-phosphate import ATP-binding protein UgpC [Occultella aeris]
MTAPATGVAAAVRVERGHFTLDVELDVSAGEVLAVVGPNASGKSTFLHVVAGLVRPSVGTVRVGERVLTRRGQRGAEPDVMVAPEHRGIGLLGQDPLLFPHLSATENVAFGLRSAGLRAGPARERAREWLTKVGLDGVGDRRPSALSGGQQQRVAIARALAAEPAVLLLDEPLAALDATAAPQIRQLLAEQVRGTGTTAVVVSHDVLDAVVLADHVAVLRDGTLVERGRCADVLSAPRTAFTAALVGTNLLAGHRDGTGVRTAVGVLEVAGGRAAADPAGGGAPTGEPDATARLSAPAAPAGRGAPDVPDGGACVVRFRPSAVELFEARPDGPNAFEATVRWLEPATGGVRVRLAGAPELLADLEPAQAQGEWLRPGGRVWARVDPAAVHLAPAA